MTTKVSIRRAKPDDVIDLSKLLRHGRDEQAEDIYYPGIALNQAKQINHVLQVIDKGFVVIAEAREKGKPAELVGAIGMSIIRDEWSDEWLMNNEWFYVLPDWRETDVSLAMIKMVEQFADENGDPATGKGLPVIIGMMTGRDVMLKDELMSQLGYQYGGGNFVRAPKDVVQQEEGSEAGDPAVAGGGKQTSG